jgi:alkylation response protein AidB-like acyl-CoA dehydrogenase
MKIYYNASEEQKKRFLPAIAKGELRFAFGLTEPNAGSDAANTQTRAVPDGDNFIINGNKIFITGSHVADYVMTVTRTDPNVPKHKGLTIFFVETKTKGFSAMPLGKFGGRAVASCELVYEDVVVPKDAILGGPDRLNDGWKQVFTTLNVERIVIAASYVGEGKLALQEATQYAKERVQFGQPIGKFQAVQHMLAEVATEIEAARWLTYRAAWLRKENQPCAKEASMAKLFASETSKKAALTGVQVMGGYGYMNEFDMQRHLRNAILAPIGGGTSQIQKNIIARQMGI